MNKLIAMVWTASTALFVLADTWVDPKTGLMWKYEISDDNVAVGYRYNSEPVLSETVNGEIVIPDVIDGKIVTRINHGIFKGFNGITSIVVPKSVTYIEYGAFSGCGGG